MNPDELKGSTTMERNLTGAAAAEELVLKRVFGAPRALVFKAWTEPEHLARWWGPRRFTAPRVELDVRPGGAISLDMQGPDGVIYPMTGVFEEVVPPARLVFTDRAVEDAQGNPGLETRTTVTFDEMEGMTLLTLRVQVLKVTPEAAGALAGMEQGWSESLYRLGELVEAAAEAGEPAEAAGYQATPPPSPELRRLDRLVGTWQVRGRESGPEGEIHGQVRFEWLPGGYYLAQYIDMVHIDHEIQGIEIIGYPRSWDGATSADCLSHYFGNTGEMFTYVYDVDDATLTIWGGERGSPAAFKGRFSPDGRQISGAWEWPGGGYSATMTKVA